MQTCPSTRSKLYSHAQLKQHSKRTYRFHQKTGLHPSDWKMMTETTTRDYQKCARCGIEKQWAEFNKDRRTASGYRDICSKCRSMHRRIVHHANKDKEAILESQNNACAICGVNKQDSATKFVMDHNHQTYLIRGILCSNCNVGLGYFRDKPTLLAMAIKYLMETDGAT
jgi:hypothetical protein